MAASEGGAKESVLSDAMGSFSAGGFSVTCGFSSMNGTTDGLLVSLICAVDRLRKEHKKT